MILKRWQLIAIPSTLLATLWLVWPSNRQINEVKLKAASLPKAVVLLETAHRENPGDVAITRKLTGNYEATGRLQEAAKAWQQTAQATALPDADHVHALKLALQVGDVTMARQLQHAYVTHHSQDLPALLRWRDLALASQALPEAISAQQAIYALQTNQANQERLIQLHVQNGQPGVALKVLESAKFADVTAWHRQGAQLALWAKAPAAAFPHLKALYEAAPEAVTGRQLLQLLIDQHDAQRVAFARELAQRFPQDREARKALRQLLQADGLTAEWLDLLQKDVAESPDDTASHRVLVAALLGQSRQDMAIAELQRWLARRPGDAESQHQLAQTLVWSQQVGAAWSVYAALLGNETVAAPVPWRQEWAAVSDELDDATLAGSANLRALSSLQPDDPRWVRRLASATADQGQVAEATHEQQTVVTRPGATAADGNRLVTWLLGQGLVPEALAQFLKLDPRLGMPTTTLYQIAQQAGEQERWAEAATALAMLTQRMPTDPLVWERLGDARERLQDWPAAITAWRQRVALGQTTPTVRLRLARLLEQHDTTDTALSVLEATKAQASVAEWREMARLHLALHRIAPAKTALQAVLDQAPADVDMLLALADLEAETGTPAVADALDERALKAAPDDPTVLTRVAARRVYGPSTATAGALVAQLAQLPTRSPVQLRLLAEYYRLRQPQRAAGFLDDLHAQDPGTPGTWFLRGDLAQTLGAPADATIAWQQVITLAAATPDDPGNGEAAAMAYDRLGQTDKAQQTWRQLAVKFPQRLAPQVAQGRYFLQQRQPDKAAPFVTAALKVAPESFDARLLQAEWLQSRKAYTDALPIYEKLRQEKPNLAYLSAQEATIRQALGQTRQARLLGRTAVEQAPGDVGYRELYRSLLDDGASRLGGFGHLENVGLLQRQDFGAEAAWRLDDRLRIMADVRQLAWGGARSQTQQLGLGGEWKDLAWQASGQIAAATSGELLGNLQGSWHNDTLAVQAKVQDKRWEDNTQTVAALGHERAVESNVTWRPLPPVRVTGTAGLGQLSLSGQTTGVSTTLQAGVEVKPDVASPFAVNYDFRHRGWGAAAAPAGLPSQTDVHSLLGSYTGLWGPLKLTFQPGISYDMAQNAVAPVVAGALWWNPVPDVEIALDGAWSSRVIGIGSDQPYTRVQLQARWWL